MLSESTVTAWKIEKIEGQDVVQLDLSLPFDQYVKVNLAPHTIPNIVTRLMNEYMDWTHEIQTRSEA